MFCSECGVKAGGKFCWSCGEALRPVTASQLANTNIDAAPADSSWEQLTDYQTLVSIPAVRDRIAAHAARSQKKFTGEEFLEACDKVLTPLTGGVPFTVIANLTQPISTRLGLKTGKSRTERFTQSPGTVIVAILSSLAEHGQKLGDVTQHQHGCTLRAALPSDMWSLKGDFIVDVRSESSTSRPATIIEAAITIPGQIYDWGKSRRCLDHLFDDIINLSKAA